MSKAVRRNSFMRSTLEQMCAQFDLDKPLEVMFTTFNFSPRFFEANVIPLLLGYSADELAAAAETRHAMNQRLRTLRCVVVCDRSVSAEPKADVRYGLLPVGLAKGRFHPKLTLISGTLKSGGQGLWLSVGSGNLTLSGWGLNREVCAATPVAQAHADVLRPLLDWIALQAAAQVDGGAAREEGDTRAILDALVAALADANHMAVPAQGMPSLHVALPGRDRASLLDSLAAGRRWHNATVVSPYWSDVDALLEQIGAKECVLVPSLRDGAFRFPMASLSSAMRKRCSFGKFTGQARFTHAKAICLADSEGNARLAVGSANFTRAALGVGIGEDLANVEAMLCFDGPVSIMPAFAFLAPQDIEDQPELDDEPGAPPLPPFDAVAVYDWKARAFRAHITMHKGQRPAPMTIILGNKQLKLTRWTNGRASVGPLYARCSQPVRVFALHYADGRGQAAAFHGLVTQLNAHDDELRYHPPPVLKKVLGFLCGLDPDARAANPRMREASVRDDGDGEEDVEPTFDYYALFQATWKLRAYLEHARHAAIDPFDQLSPYSVATLYRAIVCQPANSAEEQIGRYVQLAEVRSLVGALPGQKDATAARTLCAEIDDELKTMRPQMGRLLKKSQQFRAMFGGPADKQVVRFLEWFHAQLREECDGTT